jgi:broad specificity phosphatase PhoE
VTTFLLTRHAETDWNRERRWQGHADQPLNAAGRKQAEALADVLEGVALDAIYASDLRRAYETAAPAAERRGLAVTQVRALREIDVGSWTGQLQDEVQQRFPEAYRAVRTRSGRGWEGGETYRELVDRVLEAVRRIALAHPADTVLVVTHSGPLRAVRAHALGLDFATDRKAAPAIDRLAVSAVTVEDGVFRLSDGELQRHLAAGGNRA